MPQAIRLSETTIRCDDLWVTVAHSAWKRPRDSLESGAVRKRDGQGARLNGQRSS